MGLAFQMGCNGLQHAVHVSQNIIVPEANDAIALGFEKSGSGGVPADFGVLAAVDLYDQLFFPADEVANEGSNRNLP